ncbi:hypothetical protein [Puniceicoccus vermicola]|uniref:Uncharacterized protein n=1 Tax=Puniceicoccus vermicola TaxID=388746 RepID=A0A7X1E512_9BACT|nr:hypothetical protein [Puniceicoccus vermicola]MBC2603155.1 hypothetical protein [Puniceicoccus vermicola]
MDRIYAQIAQLFSYYYWDATIKNPVVSTVGTPESDPRVLLVQNGIVSGFLLTLRKLHEFFEGKTEGRAFQGDVFASDFPGFQSAGGFLSKDDFTMLHKEIGHITIPEKTGTDISGEAFQACVAAFERVTEFLNYLEQEFISDEKKPRLRAWRSFLDESMDSYCVAFKSEQDGYTTRD